MAKIRNNARISLDESEFEETFILGSGPGGQNVNKVASAVQLRFDVGRSPSLPDDVRTRLMRLCGRRLTKNGVLVITARRFRTQEQNRADARARLADLIERASIVPVKRRPTRPSGAAKRRRQEEKKSRSALKRRRTRPALE